MCKLDQIKCYYSMVSKSFLACCFHLRFSRRVLVLFSYANPPTVRAVRQNSSSSAVIQMPVPTQRMGKRRALDTTTTIIPNANPGRRFHSPAHARAVSDESLDLESDSDSYSDPNTNQTPMLNLTPMKTPILTWTRSQTGT